MPGFHILVIRLVVAAALAVVITRMFFHRIDPVYVLGMTIFFVGGAYASAHFRNRDK